MALDAKGSYEATSDAIVDRVSARNPGCEGCTHYASSSDGHRCVISLNSLPEMRYTPSFRFLDCLLALSSGTLVPSEAAAMWGRTTASSTMLTAEQHTLCTEKPWAVVDCEWVCRTPLQDAGEELVPLTVATANHTFRGFM